MRGKFQENPSNGSRDETEKSLCSPCKEHLITDNNQNYFLYSA